MEPGYYSNYRHMAEPWTESPMFWLTDATDEREVGVREEGGNALLIRENIMAVQEVLL